MLRGRKSAYLKRREYFRETTNDEDSCELDEDVVERASARLRNSSYLYPWSAVQRHGHAAILEGARIGGPPPVSLICDFSVERFAELRAHVAVRLVLVVVTGSSSSVHPSTEGALIINAWTSW